MSWKQRYVQTERLMAEKKAGRSLFGLLSAPFTNHPCVQALMQSPANTNVIIHHGKLLAMHEIGAPYEMDPSMLTAVRPRSRRLITQKILSRPLDTSHFPAKFRPDVLSPRIPKYACLARI